MPKRPLSPASSATPSITGNNKPVLVLGELIDCVNSVYKHYYATSPIPYAERLVEVRFVADVHSFQAHVNTYSGEVVTRVFIIDRYANQNEKNVLTIFHGYVNILCDVSSGDETVVDVAREMNRLACGWRFKPLFQLLDKNNIKYTIVA